MKKIKIENLKNSGNNFKNSRNNSPIFLLNKSNSPKNKRLSPNPKRIKFNIENKISNRKIICKSSSSQDKKKSKIK